MNRQDHWNAIYTTKDEQEVSWFEMLPAMSLYMLEAAGLTRETCVLDVGAGDSRLVDALVSRGLDCLAVLDVSEAALHRAQRRLGPAAAVPVWLTADVADAWSLLSLFDDGGGSRRLSREPAPHPEAARDRHHCDVRARWTAAL
jgi:hypothetical protein